MLGREICPKRLANGQPRPEMVLVWYERYNP
jgi:hypothetical protein